VSFTIDGQEYAIDIARVQEIVQVPETIVHVPNSPAHMLGLMTLRERLLPLVSLRSLFGLPVRETDERSRIVVVALDAAAIGVVTDSVSEVLRVPKDIVDVLPPLLARGDDMGDISQICRLEGGKRLVSIISADHIFRHSAVKDALRTGAAMSEDKQNERMNVDGADDEEQVVVFRLAEGEFGVPLDSVQEIVRVPEKLNHVPKTPPLRRGRYQPARHSPAGHGPEEASRTASHRAQRPPAYHGVPARWGAHRLHCRYGNRSTEDSQGRH